jgi:hypothetical protein
MPETTSRLQKSHTGRVLRPRKYVVTERCTRGCSLGEHLLPGNAFAIVHGWFEEGVNNQIIHDRSIELGLPLSLGAIGRHRGRHLVPADHMKTVAELEEDHGVGDGPPLSDLEILERLIQVGSRSLADKKQRVSPDMLMKAMELKYKLTQGNVFQGFLDAVNDAMSDPEDGPPESPAALATADEAAQVAPED